MSVPAGAPVNNDEIARVAHAIWEAEGQPDGRDHDHWMRARQLIEDGAATEFLEAAALRDEEGAAPRPVQPGFEAAGPGVVPVMKDEPGEELREDPGGRFAKQLADLPEDRTAEASRRPATPGPQNPHPEPATNAGGSGASIDVPAGVINE